MLACIRFVLALAALFYAAAIALRNFLYSKGWLKTYRPNAPVISIGNITVGGTGKTPLVIWLCNMLSRKGIASVILTRGYKTKKGDLSDEPALLRQTCRQAEVIVNSNRAAAADKAVNQFGAKVLIMDDGFQHRRLQRDVDIVTIDATCPFGYGKLLPAGLLREAPGALKRAHAVVITRCDQITQEQLSQLQQQLKTINAEMIITTAIHNPICAKSGPDEEISLQQLSDKRIFAFCAIGNPESFLSTIKALQCKLAGAKFYNDHHHYSEADISDIYKTAQSANADLILTTHKDYTKIAPFLQPQLKLTCRNREQPPKNIRFAYLAIELKFTAGEDKLRRLIQDKLAGKIIG